MPRFRIMTLEQLQYAVEVALARRRLPSDKQLARQFGVSVSAIHKAVYRHTSVLNNSVSQAKDSAKLGGNVSACHAQPGSQEGGGGLVSAAPPSRTGSARAR